MIEYKSSALRMWSRLGPSGAFGIAAMELGATQENVVMVTADLRFFSGLDRFAAAYPEKIYNIGIAEQNLVGFAAGLASEGICPFATTCATFASLRAANQVKVNMAYMQRNVKLIGLTAGFAAGMLGPAHMGLEDIAAMRAMPGITIIDPADCCEIVKSVLAAAETPGPFYIRFSGSMNCPMVYENDYPYQIGKAITLREGKDVQIIACGSMVYHSLLAAALLEEDGISCGVLNMHTINPLDTDAIDALNAPLLVSAEEHSVIGGLGGAIAEHLSNKGGRPLLRIGTEGSFLHAGSYEYLMKNTGLWKTQIAEKIKHRMGEMKV